MVASVVVVVASVVVVVVVVLVVASVVEVDVVVVVGVVVAIAVVVAVADGVEVGAAAMDSAVAVSSPVVQPLSAKRAPTITIRSTRHLLAAEVVSSTSRVLHPTWTRWVRVLKRVPTTTGSAAGRSDLVQSPMRAQLDNLTDAARCRDAAKPQ